jgi:hypothetical protein
MHTPGHRGRLGRRRWIALVGGAVLVVAGCGQSSQSSPPDTSSPPTTVAPAAPTANAAPNLGSGQATMTGTVEGPQGPVPGATVEIERVVNGIAAQATVTSGPGGAWNLQGVPGGSYSIRAWLPPNLAQTSATTFFLAGQAVRAVTLDLISFSTPLVQAAIAPDPPVTGQLAQVVVQVTSRQVQADGTIVNQPAAGQSVQLDGQGAWLIPPPNPATTGSSGQATWTVTCDEAGNQSLTASLGAQPVPLGLSPCEAAPSEPSTSSTTSTTTATTTTTLPSSGQPPAPFPTVGG